MRRWWMAGAAGLVGLLAFTGGASAAQIDRARPVAHQAQAADKHDYAVTINYTGSVESGWVGCAGFHDTVLMNQPGHYLINHFGSCEITYHWNFRSHFDLAALVHSNRPVIPDEISWDNESDAGGRWKGDVQFNCIDTYPLAGYGPDPSGDSCLQNAKPWTGTSYATLYGPWLRSTGRPFVDAEDNGFDLRLTSPIDDSAVNYDPSDYNTFTGPASDPGEDSAWTGWYSPIWNVVGSHLGCVFDYDKLNASWHKFYMPKLEVRFGQPATMTQTIHKTYFKRFPNSGGCSSFLNSEDYQLVGQAESVSMLLKSKVDVSLKVIH